MNRIIILCLFIPLSVNAQYQLSLQEAIALARTQSVDAAVALNELKTAYWEYRTYKADLLPEINFSGVLPDYDKSYKTYQQEDGSYTFVRNNALGLSGQLAIDQNLWFTGGKLSLNSSLEYVQQLGSDSRHSFMSIPIALTFVQPVFGVNSLKWRRRIEPIRYEEAKASFIIATEEVTLKTISYFFDLLLARENLGIAKQNLENADRLYEIALAKKEMGQISENELLQLKLSALKAKATLTDYESNLKAKMFQLRAFLGMSENEVIDPVLPDIVPEMKLLYETVLEKALSNHSFALNIRRRQLEADYDVAAAKGSLRSVDLYASVGLTGENRNIGTTYNHLKDNQIIQVGVKIPILDWGKRRGKVKVAESNREVVASRIRQDQMNFYQDIFLLVEQFNNQAAQLMISDEADKIAQQRYRTSIETFLIGKINTLDLNDAQVSKDEARQKHISELYLYWYYYHQIRSLTLWDFRNNTGLEADIEQVVKKERTEFVNPLAE